MIHVVAISSQPALLVVSIVVTGYTLVRLDVLESRCSRLLLTPF